VLTNGTQEKIARHADQRRSRSSTHHGQNPACLRLFLDVLCKQLCTPLRSQLCGSIRDTPPNPMSRFSISRKLPQWLHFNPTHM